MILSNQAQRRLIILIDTVRRFLAETLALFGFYILFQLYIIPEILHPNIVFAVPNVFILSAGLIPASMIFIGMGALRRTPLDLMFFAWVLLVVASHFYSIVKLDRQLPESSMVLYLIFVGSMWGTYRAGFALTRIAPNFAPWAMMVALLFVLSCSALLGILQAVGPVRQQAAELGASLSNSSANLLEGAAIGRPTGIYGGPNILGYANIIAAICLVSIGITYARGAKTCHVLLIMMGLGILGYSTLLSQSRTSIAIYALVVLVYGYGLRRFGAPRMAMTVYAGLCSAATVLAVYTLQSANLGYVSRTFSSDITKDSSVLIRQQSYTMLGNVASDLAPLGSGVGQANQVNLLGIAGYDRYWVMGVDNEWLNMFLAHGVWGPLLVALLLAYSFRESRRAIRNSSATVRLVGYVGMMVVLLNIIFSPSAVRIAKYETGIFTSVILGALFGSTYQERRKGERSAHARALYDYL